MRNPIALLAAIYLAAGALFAPVAVATPDAVSGRPLTAVEQEWLNPAELQAYRAVTTRTTPPPSAAELTAANATARAALVTHLPTSPAVHHAYTTKNASNVDAYLRGLTYLSSTQLTAYAARNAHARTLADEYRSLSSGGTIPLEKRQRAYDIAVGVRAALTPPAAPRQTGAAPVDLTQRERSFLPSAAWTTYDNGLKRRTAITRAQHLELNRSSRDIVSAQLPAFKAEYDAARAHPTPDQIDSVLQKVVELTPDELTALAQITKDKAPAGTTITGANARIDYETALGRIPADAHYPALKNAPQAAALAKTYRDMIAAANGRPAPPQGVARIPADQLARLPQARRDQYDRDWAAADALTDPAARDARKRELNSAINAEIAQLPPAPTTARPVDFGSIKTLEDLKNLPPADRNRFCASLRGEVAAGTTMPGCEVILGDIGAATKKCTDIRAPAGATAEARATVETQRGDCMRKIRECQNPPARTPAAPTPPRTDVTDEVRRACVSILGGADPFATPGNNNNNGGLRGNVPGPDKTDKKKGGDDKSFLDDTNTRVAAIGAVTGMIFGTFFGPVGFLACVAIGAGAGYLLSKYGN